MIASLGIHLITGKTDWYDHTNGDLNTLSQMIEKEMSNTNTATFAVYSKGVRRVYNVSHIVKVVTRSKEEE